MDCIRAGHLPHCASNWRANWRAVISRCEFRLCSKKCLTNHLRFILGTTHTRFPVCTCDCVQGFLIRRGDGREAKLFCWVWELNKKEEEEHGQAHHSSDRVNLAFGGFGLLLLLLLSNCCWGVCAKMNDISATEWLCVKSEWRKNAAKDLFFSLPSAVLTANIASVDGYGQSDGKSPDKDCLRQTDTITSQTCALQHLGLFTPRGGPVGHSTCCLFNYHHCPPTPPLPYHRNISTPRHTQPHPPPPHTHTHTHTHTNWGTATDATVSFYTFRTTNRCLLSGWCGLDNIQ